ncbi:helix-turn-helix transcriptional regulator [Saccharothrix carnea]|uniref:helix-turn-helix transcriptional regulator n=1 Tax=Saccharothrix carnea TaxID=1280637 RepID=UPI000D0DABD6|nr:helix-turn-helix domain-containing protein [Saccharothrix carnea]
MAGLAVVGSLAGFNLLMHVASAYRASTGYTGYMSGSLGELIRRRRLELELTQAELGQRVGRSQVAVSEWERDIVIPSDLETLAPVLGLPVEQLVMATAAQMGTDDPFERAIWQAERLTMKQREALITIYRGLVDGRSS